MDNVTEKLQQYFGHRKFKSELQERAVRAITRGVHDVFVSMPTGSGKSLCFQLPAMLQDNKVAIVFSPLLALIKDQIDHLAKLKIPAESINSKMTGKDRERVINDLQNMRPNTKFLYITPEQAATQTFKSLMEHLVKFKKVSYVVVDEAHCVSEWGHDFRPDYFKLGDLREKHKEVPWVALTATASSEVVKDILTNLKLRTPVAQFKTPSFRRNLFYDVIYQNCIEDEIGHLSDFLKKSLAEDDNVKLKDKNAVIVYCRTRGQTEELANMLSKRGLKSLAYHGGLKSSERISVQEQWQRGEVPCVCATVSFGMGVDKATVRAVAHWGLAQNVAAYYQESGRAGRDGKSAFCRIYYCRSERNAVDFLLKSEIARSKTPEQKQRGKNAYKSFEIMVRYCEEVRCRHKTFAEFFGEEPPRCVSRCDVCADERAVRRALEQHSRRAMSATLRGGGLVLTQDSSDLYGEGRYGQRKEAESYGRDESDGSDAEDSKRRVAAETKSLIMKEFANRKKRIEERKGNEIESAQFSRCKAAESTANKVNGLTISCREQYLSLLVDALNNNLASTKDLDDDYDRNLFRADVEQCAIEMEYESFRSSTVISLYRRGMSKLVAAVKACTDQVYPELKTFEPRKRCTLGEFVKEYESQKQEKANIGGFKTASEFSFEQNNPKGEENILSKSDRDNKRKANSFKKDMLTQTRLQSFFKKASDASPRSTPPTSENEEGGLAIDENDEHNEDISNDTTLKLKYADVADTSVKKDDHNNTTLKLSDNSPTSHEMDSPEKEEQHYVLNITLKGIPSNDKQGLSETNKCTEKLDRPKESNSKSSKHKYESNKDSKVDSKHSKTKILDKESKSRHKSNKHKNVDKELKAVKKAYKHKDNSDSEAKSENDRPRSKRKIKALFGESSESENELDEPKKPKLSNNNKHKHKDKRKHSKHKKDNRKSEENKTPKHDDVKSKNDENSILSPVLKKDVLFGNASDSESEKELVIDDGSETTAKVPAAVETNESEKTMVLNSSDDQNKINTSVETSSSVLSSQDESKSLEELQVDQQTEADQNNISVTEMDEKKLTKAHRLSLEADKVLEKLKKFAEMPKEEPVMTEVVDQKLPEENKSDIHSDFSKRRLSLSLSKSKEHKTSKDGKLEKTSHKDKKIRHEKKKEHVAKKTEKVDVASLVVKLLMPYYKNKKITNRDLFKITARHIVHQLLAIQVTEEAAIDVLLKKTFSNKELKIEKESDLGAKLNLSTVL